MSDDLTLMDDCDQSMEPIRLQSSQTKKQKSVRVGSVALKHEMTQMASIYLGHKASTIGTGEERKNMKNFKERYQARQETKGSDNDFYSAIRNNSDTKVSQLIKISAREVCIPKEIYKLAKNDEEEERKIKMRDRLLKLQKAKQLLSGKTSSVWIYAIRAQISSENKDRIYEAYQGFLDDETVVPLVRNAWEIAPFLQISNSYFKIVACMDNIAQALKYKINVKVVEYYIYNHTQNLAMALEYKAESRKVKGIFTDLGKIISRTEEEIEENIMLYRQNNGLAKKNQTKKLPSFLQLSGKDKTEATLYRANLYGALKADSQQLPQHLTAFLALVNEKYGGMEKEKKHITDYKALEHGWTTPSLGQAQHVLRFYVRESFYYQVLNSMLRTLKTTEEFKPCILPFHETYASVKHFYHLYLTEHKQNIPQMTLYRGCKLKKKDFLALKKDVFIEMYGFMSTSKSKARAQSFTDNEGYLMRVHVKAREVKGKYSGFDHGFVDMNRYGLSQFAQEEEVLFNGLNVFRVMDVRVEGRLRVIDLEYGAIFNLLQKKESRQVLTPDQHDTLINYQYCTRLLAIIEDQGDVLLLANEYDEAKEYYEKRIDGDAENGINYLKLANVQKESGQIDLAEANGKKSLNLLQQKADLSDKETCLKVFSVHAKNADINLQKEDYLHADEQLTEAISMLDDSSLFEKAKKIRERGEIKFKKGEIKDAELDFQTSEKIFDGLNQQSEKKKEVAKKNYYLRLITRCCRGLSKEQIENEYDREMREVQQLDESINEIRGEILDELVIVNKSLQEVAVYAQDKSRYEYCVKKARAYLINLQESRTEDPRERAKLKVMEATIQDYLSLAQSQLLLYDAIALIEKDTPFDLAVADYSVILAKLEKKCLESNLTLSKDQMTQYDQAAHQQIYTRCKDNFQKAINVLLYNNKAKESGQVLSLKNQLGQLQLSQSNFTSCEEIIADVKKAKEKTEHTEISKASVLLAKISFARGELKGALDCLHEADEGLQKVLLKADTPQYRRVYQRSDCHLQVILLRAKIYGKQLQSDMALRQLNEVDGLINDKMDGFETHALSYMVCEEYGEIEASRGTKSFVDHFTRAIDLRVRQAGKYNTANAVTHCSIAKHYLLLKDVVNARRHLTEAMEILSCLSDNHPVQWILYFTNAFFSEKSERLEEANSLLKSSMSLIELKFDPSHIGIKKVKLRFALNLSKMGKHLESLEYLGSLQTLLDEDLRHSLQRVKVEKETDDEKITLQKIIYNELKKEHYTQSSQYQKKYDELRSTFIFDSQS